LCGNGGYQNQHTLGASNVEDCQRIVLLLAAFIIVVFAVFVFNQRVEKMGLRRTATLKAAKLRNCNQPGYALRNPASARNWLGLTLLLHDFPT